MARYTQPNFLIDSSSSFSKNVSFDSSTYLKGVTFISSPSESVLGTINSLVIDSIGPLIQIKYKQLGSMALETSLAWDASLIKIKNDISNLDISIGTLNTWNTNQDTSISTLNDWNINQDGSISLLNDINVIQDISIINLETLINTFNTWNITQDASIIILNTQNTNQDTSILTLNDWNINQDGSISLLNDINVIQDISIINLETSVNILNSWDVVQDASIVELRNNVVNFETSLGLYVLKTGDTITGPLILSGVSANLTIDSSAIFNGKAVFKSTVYFEGSTYYTSVETIDVSSAYIYLNSGLSGEPPTNLQSGIIIGRGSSDPYAFVYDEETQSFRIGISSLDSSNQYSDVSTSIVATRSDNPINNGIAIWNNQFSRFDVSSHLTFSNSLFYIDGSLEIINGLVINGLSALNTETTLLVIDSSGVVGTREIPLTDVSSVKGVSGGYDVYSNYSSGVALIKKIIPGNGLNISSDSSSITIYTNETSILSYIDASLSIRDTSLGNLSNWEVVQDLSIIELRNAASSVGTSNGLTFDGSVKLGGLLTETTTITAPYDSGFNFSLKSQQTNIGAADVSGGYSEIYASKSIGDPTTHPWIASIGVGNDITLRYYDINLATNNYIKFFAYNNGQTVTAYFDDYGFIYAGDYSVGWNDRHIPDIAWVKTYVDSSISQTTKKYIGTFDGSTLADITIPAVTHNLGVGPFHVSVYDQNQLVYPAIYCYDNGDVSIYWSPGTMSASCKYIIVG